MTIKTDITRKTNSGQSMIRITTVTFLGSEYERRKLVDATFTSDQWYLDEILVSEEMRHLLETNFSKLESESIA